VAEKSRKKLKFNWRKWCDEFVLADNGIVLATKEKRFWAGFIPAFLLFGMLINLLSGGLSKFELMGAVGFSGSMKIILDAFLGIFGINMIFLEWVPVFFLALLQGILIGLIVLLWHKKRINNSNETSNSANVEKAGIITGLIALGAGCPTCGTTLLTPLLGAIFSTSGLALVGIVSNIVTSLAILIAILSLKRIGEETYVIIINEKYLKKKEECEKRA
jgi:hypothetical protein